jgi:hypothetical protein
MARQLAFALAAGLSLCGCSHEIAAHDPSLSARAEFGRAAVPHHVKRLKSRHADNALMSSKVIAPRADESPDSDDDEISKKLVICRGCEDSATNIQANAIWPKSVGAHLTVDQVSRLFPAQSALGSGLR